MKCFHWVDLSCNVSQSLICIFIIIIFNFCRFRLVSPRSYIVTLIPTLNKFHKQTNKPHLNFIFGMEIKSKFTFQIDGRKQIGFYFYLHFVFYLLP